MTASVPGPSILVVDDEAALRRVLRDLLGAAGFEVRLAETGTLALGEVVLRTPDLIVLDLGLPDVHGLEVIRAVAPLSPAPLLVLSVFGDEREKVAALEAGADDYMTKPFSGPELVARIRSLLRRGRQPQPGRALRFGPIEVDLSLRQVLRDGVRVRLTAIEYALLHLFVTNPERVLTHRRILRDLWGPAAETRTHYLRTYMTRLRRKLSDEPGPGALFQTESGIGYRFVPPSGCGASAPLTQGSP